MSNKLDPDQAQHFVRPDLGPICLQRLSTDDTRRNELKINMKVLSCLLKLNIYIYIVVAIDENQHFSELFAFLNAKH